ncbi:MAG: 1,4-dihydroxy-2-naphthoate octaprenyltransferase [Candidatus Krumholzibacteriales bacterium]
MPSPKTWLKELRLEFLTGSATPVLLGTAVARYESGEWNPLLFLLTLAGAVALHLGANTANDYFDHLSGNDPANVEYVRPFTGGSRLIQEGLIKPRTVLATSLSFFAAALVAGLILTAIRGFWILVLGLIGAVCGYFYTAPPLRLAHRGLGEIVIGISFGLIGPGAYFVQTGEMTLSAVLATLPVMFLITAVIWINEFQDSRADQSAGKNTLVVRLGRKGAVVPFAVLTLCSYLPLITGTALGELPSFTLLALITLPLGIRSIATARRHYGHPRKLAPANSSAVINHLLTGIILTAAYLIIA